MNSETIANAGTQFPSQGPRSGNIDVIMATYLQSMQNVPSELHLGAGGLTYTGLRFLARTPQVAAIIRTRVNQVAEFARAATSDFSTGFRIVPTDPSKKISARVEDDIKYVTNLILNGGGMWFIGGFEAFVRAIITDSLTYDMATFEIVTETDIYGEEWPIAIVPVDPTTIRRAVPVDEKLIDTKRWDFDDIAYVQWLDNEIKAEFTAKQLACGIRNPRTWIYAGGYGHPELEQLIFIVSNIINAQASNAANYMTGVHGNTLIELQTKMKDKKFATTERIIQAALSGPRQNKKTAIVQTNPDNNEAIKVHHLGGESNADMQYSDWINFLLKTICSLYAIDPAEMGFIFGTENVKNQQYADSPVDRIISSKERGLRPIIRALAQWLNFWVIQPYWPHLKLEFVGFDARSEKEQNEFYQKSVTLWDTPNEIRAIKNKPPLMHPAADLPINTVFQLMEHPEPPSVIEFDSLSAWVNGRRTPTREAA